MHMSNIPEWFNNIYVILPLLVWTGFWKGLALWHAARRAESTWFIVLLVIQTVGILEIVYLFRAGKLKSGQLFSK